MKRTATTPISSRRAKKTKVATSFSILAPEHRDITKFIASWLPVKDQVNFALTCKTALKEYLPEKEDFPKQIQLDGPATKVNPWDTLTINVASFLDVEGTKEKYGKVKHVKIFKDSLRFGEDNLFPVQNLAKIFPDLEILEIHSISPLFINDPPASVKKLRLYIGHETVFMRGRSSIFLFHSLEELYIDANKYTHVLLAHSNLPGTKKIGIKKLHGRCTLERIHGTGFPSMKHGKGSRQGGLHETEINLNGTNIVSV